MLKDTLFSARLLPSIKECLRIVYADIEKGVARFVQLLDFQCGPAGA